MTQYYDYRHFADQRRPGLVGARLWPHTARAWGELQQCAPAMLRGTLLTVTWFKIKKKKNSG